MLGLSAVISHIVFLEQAMSIRGQTSDRSAVLRRRVLKLAEQRAQLQQLRQRIQAMEERLAGSEAAKVSLLLGEQTALIGVVAPSLGAFGS